MLSDGTLPQLTASFDLCESASQMRRVSLALLTREEIVGLHLVSCPWAFSLEHWKAAA